MWVPFSTFCLCPLLVCLSFVPRSYGNPQHGPIKGPKNHTRAIEVEKDIHHRPKRGWIWNQFFVLEEHIGSEPQYVGKLHSNSDKGDGSVRYLLSGEGAGTIFLINEVTGDIHATKSLDREKKAHYVLHAQAIDRHTNRSLEPESEFIIKVQDVNDNAPKFLDGPSVASVAEMSDVGTSVFQVSATDADDPTYGNSARIVYSILQGQPYFSVDPKTGVIRTALANMDREAREQYFIIIQAKDMAGQVGGLSGSTTVNITLTDVNDNPPSFPQKNYQLYVPESAQVGKAVGRIKADDDDLGANAEIKYSITNAEGAAVFSISTDKDSREGIISLKKPLNYEKKRAFTLHIEGSNTHLDPRFSHLGPFADTTTLKIIVGDVDEPPVFSMDYYILDVYENAPVGTEVGTVTARDPDSTNSPIRYFIDSGLNKDACFSIDAVTGVIMTTQILDREETAWHNITVTAVEADNPSLISHIPVTVQVLDVNDNPPRVAVDDDVIVCESSRPGQVIMTVRASDDDNFANGRFSFSLPSDLPTNPNFTLKDNEDNSANIVARRRGYSKAAQESYLLPIVIWDGGVPELSSTSTLTLRVCACDRGGAGKGRVCQAPAFLSAAGLSTGAVIAILLCVAILLAIVVLFITLRSKKGKKEPLIISEEDVRENVVTYDDEGGGEEDTEAFDIAALRNPAGAEELRLRRDIVPEEQREKHKRGSPSPLLDEEDVHTYLEQRLAEADVDTSVPPYDSLQTYAYEGRGSPTGTVSSLDLAGASSEQDYSYLDDLGPEFHKLAELLGEPEPDETT
uniref:Cadherin 18 n=1 Tax=Paramormyrops kingsleyae TaxID=1676925 RepID=A0A3B3T4W3_9TELE|nr:cadherin-18-like [Paramormyrops kingsleyae]XP_023671987.1 cadherin-18-like [Paramormyrops kingsleyae]XP_023671988.1 cadherin-18-like [Paramormyrops kingsleyae]XP_023671989.1 cadherin-18-like [Paramormyrops kingsleyae]XP_023671991.1 cadherin-18-like [Paramormyrops kingsleyae]XP_023671992.1 cadherin-18-like [Paramormyrops kingsleyae]